MENIVSKGICFCFLFITISCWWIDNADGTHNVSCLNIMKTMKLPPNTKISRKQSQGGKIKFHCQKGYRFSGGKSRAAIHCNNGTLSGPIPACRGCDPPVSVQNGTRKFRKLTVGSKARYSCDLGFTLVGRHVVRCGKQLKWSGNQKPYCKQNQCSPPGNIRLTNGNFTITDPSYREFSTLSFQCNDGYELYGPEDIVCRDNMWSTPRLPVCRKKRCLRPTGPYNGRMYTVDNNLYIGTTVEFVCNSGYTLYGSNTRTCQPDKTWNGTLAVCDDGRYHCRDPGIPVGSRKIGSIIYRVGRKVTYRCRPGYRIEGSVTRTCLNNRTWSGVQPRCIDKKHVVFPSINDTLERFQEGFVNSLLQTTCSGANVSCPKLDARGRSLKLKYKDGLDLIFVLDTSSSIKKDKFEIAKDFVKKIVEIFGVSSSDDGTRIACVTYGTTAEEEFNFNSASVGDLNKALEKIDKIKYRGGGTATALALEKVREAIIPSGRRYSTKAVFIITDGNSNIGEKPKEPARLLKKIENLEIYVVGIGNKIKDQELRDLASGSTYDEIEEHIYHVEDFKKLSKIKKWIADVPPIDYARCGIAHFIPSKLDKRARVVGGRVSNRKDWPWAVLLNIRNDKMLCGGSLIDDEFILTAAHCLVNVKIPGQIKVMFKDKRKTVRTAIGYKPHKQYNSKTYANDIALVRIPKLRRFSRSQQKVCLPLDLSTRDLVRDPHNLFAVGWGGTKPVQGGNLAKRKDMSKELKQVELSFISNKGCAEKVQEKLDNGEKDWYFDNSTQFCAADKNGKSDTCTGDSGGPAMVLSKDTAGRDNWVQVGIVSWGNGCAQAGEYGYYTRVSAFLDWIDIVKDSNDI